MFHISLIAAPFLVSFGCDMHTPVTKELRRRLLCSVHLFQDILEGGDINLEYMFITELIRDLVKVSLIH